MIFITHCIIKEHTGVIPVLENKYIVKISCVLGFFFLRYTDEQMASLELKLSFLSISQPRINRLLKSLCPSSSLHNVGSLVFFSEPLDPC